MDNRERRRAIQEHLAGQEEKAVTLVDHNEGVPSGYVRAPFMDGMLPLICEDCGASVSWPTGVAAHSAWHQRLWERLGAI